jgi:hypothetical protein
VGEYQKEKSVAIKRLRESVLAMDEDSVLDFKQEVQTWKRLRHRNIVFFYGGLPNIPKKDI